MKVAKKQQKKNQQKKAKKVVKKPQMLQGYKINSFFTLLNLNYNYTKPTKEKKETDSKLELLQ